MNSDDVTIWLNDLCQGDEDAAQKIWSKYFDKLVRLARGKLNERARRVHDEEDIALSALDSFFRGAEKGKFPELNDRENLWKLLVTIVIRKCCANIRKQSRLKRGEGKIRGESVFVSGQELGRGIEQVVQKEPTPEMAALLNEACQQKLEQLPDDTLRRVALLKMEGYTNQEIAEELGCVTRTIERKLDRIRQHWLEVRDSAGEDNQSN